VKCVICGAELREKRTNLPFEYKGRLALIKGIHAHVCEQCGESYLPPESDALLKALLDKIDSNKVSFQELRAVVEVAP